MLDESRMNKNSYSKFFVSDVKNFVLTIRIVHIISHYVKIIFVQKNKLKLRSFKQSIVANKQTVCIAFTIFAPKFLHISMIKRS